MTIATTEAMAPLVRKMVENQAVAISIVTGRESFQQAVGAAHLMMAASGTGNIRDSISWSTWCHSLSPQLANNPHYETAFSAR